MDRRGRKPPPNLVAILNSPGEPKHLGGIIVTPQLTGKRIPNESDPSAIGTRSRPLYALDGIFIGRHMRMLCQRPCVSS